MLFTFSYSYIDLSQSGIIDYFFSMWPQYELFSNPYLFNCEFWYYRNPYTYVDPYTIILCQEHLLIYYLHVHMYTDAITQYLSMNEFWNHFSWYRTMTPKMCWWKLGRYGRWTMCAWCFRKPYPHLYAYDWWFELIKGPFLNHKLAWWFKSGIWGPLQRYYIMEPGWNPPHRFWFFDWRAQWLRVYDLQGFLTLPWSSFGTPKYIFNINLNDLNTKLILNLYFILLFFLNQLVFLFPTIIMPFYELFMNNIYFLILQGIYSFNIIVFILNIYIIWLFFFFNISFYKGKFGLNTLLLTLLFTKTCKKNDKRIWKI